jgi:hypothetical protein
MQFGFEDLEGTTSGLGYEPLYEQDRQHAEDDEHEASTEITPMFAISAPLAEKPASVRICVP